MTCWPPACTNKYAGMLFQKRLVQHPEVEAIVGPTVSCVRVIIAIAVGGSPEVALGILEDRS